MNILLVRHRDNDDDLILADVARELRALGARAGVVWDVKPRFKHQMWALGRETAVVSFRPLKWFKPLWAQMFEQRIYNKIEELCLLEQSGIPVPKWTILKRDTEPDLSGFEPFVVVKPGNGCRGALVRVMRRDRVRWRNLEVQERRGSTKELIVQEYIHTGPWPTSYRVATVFGEPIYGGRIVADRSRSPFEGRKRDSHFFDGRTIVSSSKGCTFDWEISEDVFEFARRVHGIAFPRVPILATDIIRDYETEKLYALETNTGGLNILITPTNGSRIKRDFGLDLFDQFGGVSAIARGIVHNPSFGNDTRSCSSEITSSDLVTV